MIGDNTAIKGIRRAFTFLLEISPKVNIPSKGPYVYPANLKICDITLSLLSALKIRSTAIIVNETVRCNKVLRLRVFLSFLLMSRLKKSIAKAVVNAVIAESALEKAAAIIPIKKVIPANLPK